MIFSIFIIGRNRTQDKKKATKPYANYQFIQLLLVAFNFRHTFTIVLILIEHFNFWKILGIIDWSLEWLKEIPECNLIKENIKILAEEINNYEKKLSKLLIKN